MKTPRVYQEHFSPPPGTFELTGEAAHHLGVVLRMSVGERVVVSDGAGQDYLAEIVRLPAGKRGAVQAQIIDRLPSRPEPGVALTLAVAMSKGERFDRLIEKAAELGVASFVPVVTSRSLGLERGQRCERWQRLAREASALAGRSRYLKVAAAISLEGVLAQGEGILLSQGHRPLPRGVPDRKEQDLWLLVGPEGGFTADEVEQARQQGWRVAGLGPRNLRVDTAALVAITLVMWENGEFED